MNNDRRFTFNARIMKGSELFREVAGKAIQGTIVVYDTAEDLEDAALKLADAISNLSHFFPNMANYPYAGSAQIVGYDGGIPVFVWHVTDIKRRYNVNPDALEVPREEGRY